MAPRVMELRIKKWIPLIEEQAKSGLTKDEWCATHDIELLKCLCYIEVVALRDAILRYTVFVIDFVHIFFRNSRWKNLRGGIGSTLYMRLYQ